MPAKFENTELTREFIDQDPNAFFVFDDDLQKQNMTGVASLRTHPRGIGFVTMKAPPHVKGAAFKSEEYSKLFFDQLKQLGNHVRNNPGRKFYISKIGTGEANRHYIWETLIHHNLVSELEDYDNVVFCWEIEKLTSN